jgi:hypothetical protein
LEDFVAKKLRSRCENLEDFVAEKLRIFGDANAMLNALQALPSKEKRSSEWMTFFCL